MRARFLYYFIISLSRIVVRVIATTDDFVDMKTKITYGAVNATSDGLYLSNITIEVPDLSSPSREGANASCEGGYLVDFVKPVPENSVFLAEKDALGSARSSCATMNYTRPLDALSATPDSSAVVQGWGTAVIRTTGKRMYYRTAPLSLRRVEKECGGSSDGRTVRWTVHVCRIAYFGEGCRSFAGEYAAFCSETEAVVEVGGKTVVAAGSFSFPTDFETESSAPTRRVSVTLILILAYITWDGGFRREPLRRRVDSHERLSIYRSLD